MLKHRMILLTTLLAVCASGPIAGDEGAGRLDRLEGAGVPVIVNFHETTLEQVLEAIGDVAGFEAEIEGIGHPNVTARFGRMPVRDALVRLASELGLRYEVEGPAHLKVLAPAMPDPEKMEMPRRLPEFYVRPNYPEQARQEKVTGMAIVEVVIGEDGAVVYPSVLKVRPDGYGFAEAALEAVRQWRYEPATRDGEPVAVWLTVAVQFSLDSRKPAPEAPEGPVS